MSLGDRLFCIRRVNLDYLFQIRKPHLSFTKETVSLCLLYAGLLLACLGSLNPWFMWPIGNKFPILCAVLFIIPSLLVAGSMKVNTVYTRRDMYLAWVLFAVLIMFMQFANDRNINAYLVAAFQIPIFYALLCMDAKYLKTFSTLACKAMALLMCVSIPFFYLYLFGFRFPGRSAVFGENLYSFTNYYFFMIDDRFVWDIIPRFHSVFLEPGHLGTATVMLLLTQMGQWRKWYNVVLWFTTVITFSLAAYAFIVAMLFLNSWVHRRKIWAKVAVTVLLVAGIGIGARFYNNGDNLVNNLIMLRLEVDEKTGEMSGNNRVTASFEKEFDSFMTSSDIWFGREMPKGDQGNSGYRVFIYENGLISLLLVVCFYLLVFVKGPDSRAILASLTLVLLAFIVRGYPLWYSNFIPCMAAAYNCFKVQTEERKEE